MTAAAPWSVKGIEPKAREIAKDLARRSGMTLGEWLNQMIIEGEPEQATPAYEPQRPSYERAPYDAERRQQPRYAPIQYEPDQDAELRRISRALDVLTARMESAEHRSTLAISGIDQHVTGVLSKLDGLERDQTAIAARFDGSIEEVQTAQGRITEKLRRTAEDEGPRVEAMKALEGALSRVAEKLYDSEAKSRGVLNDLREDVSNLSRRSDRVEARVEQAPSEALAEAVIARIGARLEAAEAQTSSAVRALETSFAGLDARLQASELRQEVEGGPAAQRLERLAVELAEKVEATRGEMTERLREAADGKLDRLEQVLRDLAAHVEQGERRSAEAIDRMGREVMRVGHTLGERVQAVEARATETSQQLGGEMARIADAFDNRLAHAGAAHSEALEKLGGDIGRIAERLAERIANAERRAAQATDDVADRLDHVAESFNARHERTTLDLADRIRASEERTARFLEGARDRMGSAPVAQHVTAPEPQIAAPGPATASHDHDIFLDDTAFEPAAPGAARGTDPFAAEPVSQDPFAADPFAPMRASHTDPFGEEAEKAAFMAEETAPAPSLFAPAPVTAEPAMEAVTHKPGSTWSMIEEARAAARAASEKPARGARNEALQFVDAPDFAGTDARRSGFGTAKKKKKDDGVTLRTALLASGTAAALSVTGVSYYLIAVAGNVGDHPTEAHGALTVAASGPDANAPSLAQSAAPPLATDATAPSPESSAGEPASAPASAQPQQLAVAIQPKVGDVSGAKKAVAIATQASPPASAPAPPAGAAAAKTTYSAAVRRIESGDARGVDDLKKAANLGYAPAQFYIAKLYETGGSGVKKDLGEARRWTERAATGGDIKAMHNLGLFLFEGEGGAKDTAAAARWFRKAADQGLIDSQVNLGKLYASGYGVTLNQAEAYKWYLVAAASGDPEARTAADALKKQLTPEVQAASERTAAAFRAQTAAAAPGIATATPPAKTAALQ